ncbi:MAG: S1-like domain-containing RNA-binding protein [Methylovulum sp.]|uniref:CvfB family protein n=1 Tax=Methylovulum sp. TaxID=1916980 RepID=UPI0026094075|nr:S1-like domain-containing RNA-binding protein [Methylovulum sp.]MDD2725642.1 S1-like domain-containing RNA-binding protein [Methylovulum sp.]MDD5125570.1 S1-like domain-containing RNA-binding protein [Methylovulum sp.]
MIHIGKTNTLKIVKQQGADVYLGDGISNKVLLANKIPPHYQMDDSLEAFVYVDMDGHLAATTRMPLAQADEIAWLPVVSVNYTGAFLDWGLPKDLLVPFSEQHLEMEVGRSYLVRLFLDDKSRILATTKINRFLEETSEDFQVGEKVSLIIADKTDLGVKAIINHSCWGMLYQNELFQPVHQGQKLDGYIKQIREDNKIDLSLHQPGYGKVESITDTILAKLRANNGVLMLSDKSPPEEIYATFGVSKKVFKQAIGALYKDHKITLDKTAIRLVG